MATNVSSVVAHFPDAENGFSTTTSGSVSSGATTVGLNSVGGYTNGEPAVFVIDPTDATLKQTFTGIVDTSGVQITGVVWTAGTNTSHSAGATVVDYPTATHIAMMSKGIKVHAAPDGTLKAGAVDTAAVLASDVVTTAKILDANVTAGKLASDAVTTAKILDANVTTAKIANANVTSEKLAATIACRTYRNSSQTIEVGTEIVVFNAESFDLGSNFDTGTGQFTAPVTGYYQVNSCVQLANVNAADDQVLVHIYVNGALYSTGNNVYAVAAGDDPRVNVNDLVPATAGQTIDIRIQNASSGTETLGAAGTATDNYMSVYFVGV